MWQKLLCKLGICRKSEVGGWRTYYNPVAFRSYVLYRVKRCPHCKMGYRELDNGERR